MPVLSALVRFFDYLPFTQLSLWHQLPQRFGSLGSDMSFSKTSLIVTVQKTRKMLLPKQSLRQRANERNLNKQTYKGFKSGKNRQWIIKLNTPGEKAPSVK